MFGGARFTGIARSEQDGYLVHYVDDGKMYFTNEMRLFNNAIMTHQCKPNVIYTGHSLSEILKYLTSQSAFAKAKRNKNDAVTYRIALERTTYPLHIIECSHKGAFQLRLMSCPDYRNQIVEYAFSQSVTQNENTVIDAEINGEMFAVGVDLDLTRLKKATELASKSGRTSLSVIALPWQAAAIEQWFDGYFNILIYTIEQSEIESLIKSTALTQKQIEPAKTKEGDEYAQIV